MTKNLSARILEQLPEQGGLSPEYAELKDRFERIGEHLLHLTMPYRMRRRISDIISHRFLEQTYDALENTLLEIRRMFPDPKKMNVEQAERFARLYALYSVLGPLVKSREAGVPHLSIELFFFEPESRMERYNDLEPIEQSVTDLAALPDIMDRLFQESELEDIYMAKSVALADTFETLLQAVNRDLIHILVNEKQSDISEARRLHLLMPLNVNYTMLQKEYGDLLGPFRS